MLLIFVFLSCAVSVCAQRIWTEEVVKTSDSILLANTDERLFELFSVSRGSFYKYERKNRETTGKFLSKKKLKPDITEIWVLYSFIFPEIKEVHGGVWIKLDSELRIIEKPDLGLIPGFLWEGKACNFLSKEQAMFRARLLFNKIGFKIDEPALSYSKKHEKYVYEVANHYNRKIDVNNRSESAEAECIILDALSGELLERQNWEYNTLKSVIR